MCNPEDDNPPEEKPKEREDERSTADKLREAGHPVLEPKHKGQSGGDKRDN